MYIRMFTIGFKCVDSFPFFFCFYEELFKNILDSLQLLKGETKNAVIKPSSSQNLFLNY